MAYSDFRAEAEAAIKQKTIEMMEEGCEGTPGSEEHPVPLDANLYDKMVSEGVMGDDGYCSGCYFKRERPSRSIDLGELHESAMHLADEAEALRKAGDIDKAKNKYLRAFISERACARAMSKGRRDVLYRSAASLALEAGRPRDALDSAKRGLEVSDDPYIIDELEWIIGHAEEQF